MFWQLSKPVPSVSVAALAFSYPKDVSSCSVLQDFKKQLEVFVANITPSLELLLLHIHQAYHVLPSSPLSTHHKNSNT